MFALSIYRFSPNSNEVSFEQSDIVPLPSELCTIHYVNTYRAAKPGWNKCALGYSYFVRERPNGSRLVVPGVQLLEDTPKKKLYFPPLKLSRAHVERLVDRLVEEEQALALKLAETRRETEAELTLLVHDLRQFSSSIYNAAFQARSEHDRARSLQVRQLIETILATQAMLSVRIDSLDLASNPTLLISQDIPVYRKVDKMVRSFQPMASNKRVSLSIWGSSFGTTCGPDVFEMIPFALIENAIKYSPVGHDINVRVHETKDVIQFDVTSVGPEIEQGEFAKIFEKHYRGKNAADTGRAGSGIGLSNAKMLVEDHFNGRIWANQETVMRLQIGLVEYFTVTFHVEVPRNH